MKWIDEFVEDYNQRVYNGLMSPQAKKLLREMKRKEHEAAEREWLHEELQAKHGEFRQ